MAEDLTIISIKDIKPGKFIMIDGFPCKVVDIETSSPGKHGAAKARITAIGVFDGKKRTLLKPTSSEVEAPVILKKRAQVVSITGDTVQLMDLETYETYELPAPEDIKGTLKPGAEVEVMEAMGQRSITRIVGGA
ncbi:MAG: translation initiation factor IF-5A [Candidatus Micrarchaeia archaeon]